MIEFVAFLVLASIVTLGGYLLGKQADRDSEEAAARSKSADERYEDSWDE